MVNSHSLTLIDLLINLYQRKEIIMKKENFLRRSTGIQILAISKQSIFQKFERNALFIALSWRKKFKIYLRIFVLNKNSFHENMSRRKTIF